MSCCVNTIIHAKQNLKAVGKHYEPDFLLIHKRDTAQYL